MFLTGIFSTAFGLIIKKLEKKFGCLPIRQLIQHFFHSTWKNITEIFNSIAKSTISGYKEIINNEQEEEWKKFLKFYLAAIIVPGAIAALSAPTLISQSENNTGNSFITLIVTYNFLSIIPILATWLFCLVALAFSMGIFSDNLKFKMNIKGSFTTVARFVGYGTLLGLISATLMPITARFHYTDKPNLQIKPEAFITFPSYGAFLFFSVGLCISVFTLWDKYDSIIWRRLIMPLASYLLLWAVMRFPKFKLTPREIFNSSIVEHAKTSIKCTPEAIVSQEPSYTFIEDFFRKCGSASIMSEGGLLISVGIIFIASAIYFLHEDFKSRLSIDAANDDIDNPLRSEHTIS
ncbi:hypothetical protein BM477_02695 [Boudabousia marimammalium]|uniref:Uncharacterized protein n=1 Tax=Boudabousia marimammalium TaxID=156892 RepID=A0A1Q5PS04_9ACTO|nr:hypothetical protein BM477_02695 [Boudabousia marimammalium]